MTNNYRGSSSKPAIAFADVSKKPTNHSAAGCSPFFSFLLSSLLLFSLVSSTLDVMADTTTSKYVCIALSDPCIRAVRSGLVGDRRGGSGFGWKMFHPLASRGCDRCHWMVGWGRGSQDEHRSCVVMLWCAVEEPRS
jgi:hypothetical protein